MAEYDKYQKYQKYINGVPADPPEYMRGELIGTGEYDSKADCESNVLYRWVDNGKTVCKGYSLYNQEKKQKSTDKGVTWTDTNEVRDGNKLIDQYSTECGWELQTRWTKTGKTGCNGYSLSEEYIKQESWDMGKTWYNSVPGEYKYEVIDSYNENCILNSEPLTYEVTAESVDLSLEMGLISISMHVNTKPNELDRGYKELTYKFWIQWDEEESIVPYNTTKKIEGRQTGSSYRWDYPHASNYRVPGHQYLENKTHTIKVWGMAVVIGTPNVPFKILKWGTAYGLIVNDLIELGWGELKNYTRYAPYYSYHARTINLSGDNLLQWAMVKNNELFYNDKFVSTNTQMDHLPVTTFQGMQTVYLDVSDNAKLLSIPPLQEGEDNKAWRYLIAKNCTSLTETPSGIWQNKIYKDSSGRINWDSYDSFNCTDAFNGCTNLTKINGPIKVDIATRMFMNTGLQDISNVDLVIREADSMFEGLSTLTTLPKSLESYEETEEYVIVAGNTESGYIGPGWPKDYPPSRERMFYGTGITEATEYIMLDPTRLYVYSHSEYALGCSYASMFENSSIAKVSGILPEINLSRFNYNRMFANTQVSEVSSYFSNITQLPSMNQMFFNCKLTQIPNDFINKDTVDVDVNRFQGVFANNFSLTNYPIQDNIAIWYWTGFYPNANLINTFAFSNCHPIEDQVPLQWGGFISLINPVIIETEGTRTRTSITVDAIGTIKGPDGSMSTGKTTFLLKEGVNTIRIWTSDSWNISGSDYKILDFGSNGMISSESNPNYITYLGTDQGAFKASTKFPLESLKNVEGVSVDFLKSGTNINSLDNLFEYNTKLTSIPEGTFSKLANLSGADYMLRNSHIENVDGLFEGCANLISAHWALKDCVLLISAQRTFKDCTKLSDIDSIFGDRPQYETLAVNCNQLFENTGVEIFSLSSFLKLSSAVGMFRNNSKLTTINTQFTLEGDNVDLTEMFKDCPLLNNAANQYVFKLSGTANFTRCWQNCTSLSYIPKVIYAGNVVNPWEVPNAVGTQCFNGCTALLQSFGDQIPDGWK